MIDLFKTRAKRKMIMEVVNCQAQKLSEQRRLITIMSESIAELEGDIAEQKELNDELVTTLSSLGDLVEIQTECIKTLAQRVVKLEGGK